MIALRHIGTTVLVLAMLNHSIHGQTSFSQLYSWGPWGSGGVRSAVEVEDGYILIGAGFGETTNIRRDLQLLKIDFSGEEIWRYTYGEDSIGYSTATSASFISTSDGMFLLVGLTTDFAGDLYDAFAMKFKTNGAVEWITHLDLVYRDYPISVIEDNDGNYIMNGHAVSGPTGPDAYDTFIAKLDPDGHVLCTNVLVKPRTQQVGSMAMTSNGSVYMPESDNSISPVSDYDLLFYKLDDSCGVTLSSIQTRAGWDCTAVLQPSWSGDELIYVSCRDTITENQPWGAFDPYLARMDTLGNVLWRTYFDWSDDDGMFALTAAKNNAVVAVGEYYNEEDGAYHGKIVKVDEFGNVEWDRSYYFEDSRFLFSNLYAVLATSDGGYLCVGKGADVASQMWALKVDSVGCLNPGCDSLVSYIPTEHIKLRVYPTIVVDQLFVDVLNFEPTMRAKIYSLMGSVELHNQPIFSNPSLINVAGLPAGMYLVTLEKAGKIFHTAKFIKQKD